MPAKRSTRSRRSPKSPTYQLTRHFRKRSQLIKNPRKWVNGLIGISLVLAFTLPIFRSGLRTNLTLLEFVINHTIWGPPVEFIPEEDYTGIFSKDKDSTHKSTTTDGIMGWSIGESQRKV